MQNPFHSPRIDALRKGGSMELPNGQRVLFPRAFGFCGGVRHAVDLLAGALEKGRCVWLLGAMIHNPSVNSWFIQNGAVLCDEPSRIFDLAQPQDVFVVPAFGLPVGLTEQLESWVQPPGRIVDATCAFVQHVWAAAQTAGCNGSAVVVHGKSGHQETESIWSRATLFAPACVLLSTLEEARAFAKQRILPPRVTHPELLDKLPWTLVNQTTVLSQETLAVAELLDSSPWHQAAFTPSGTVCPATRARQEAALELCHAACDVILVIGGTDSSNTTQLYRLATTVLPPERCLFLEDEHCLTIDTIRHYNPTTGKWQCSPIQLLRSSSQIGILAGASCPDSSLDALLNSVVVSG